MSTQLTFYDETAEGWERSLMAFLGEKQRRSGSRRTPESYSRGLPTPGGIAHTLSTLGGKGAERLYLF